MFHQNLQYLENRTLLLPPHLLHTHLLRPRGAGGAVPQLPHRVQLGAQLGLGLGVGSASAPVTVVEYADYHCPYCERFFTDAFPDIKAKYIDTGKVKFYYQDFPFLAPDSTTAAEAAQCANDQGDFWQYHDYLFNHQGGEDSGDFALSDQQGFAQTLGLFFAPTNLFVLSVLLSL